MRRSPLYLTGAVDPDYVTADRRCTICLGSGEDPDDGGDCACLFYEPEHRDDRGDRLYHEAVDEGRM